MKTNQWFTVWSRDLMSSIKTWVRVSDYPTLRKARNAARRIAFGRELDPAYRVKVAPSDVDLSNLN